MRACFGGHKWFAFAARQLLNFLLVIAIAVFNSWYLTKEEDADWQVCALFHTRVGNHEAALDDYLRDKTRISRPFTFITQMLDHKDGLQGSVMGNFREAVLARVPQLMQYSS